MLIIFGIITKITLLHKNTYLGITEIMILLNFTCFCSCAHMKVTNVKLIGEGEMVVFFGNLLRNVVVQSQL